MSTRTILFLALLMTLALKTPCFAQGHLSGTVYQIEPQAVYVTAPDHSVMLVPADTATFKVHGVTVDYRDLAIGTPVDVDYLPVYGFQAYYGVSDPDLAGVTLYRPVTLRSVTGVPVMGAVVTEPAPVVRYLWYDGRWHRQ